ncbi:AfsR/SARP family transcriptional regulator [Actinomadura miaoliensis]|uniref:BTAD domain-containing putative transcriptional regulator n=1 Tax=Actinomadura miaoliensis TaxID=430685 RepID=A0ABP7WRF3_9ACTN
MLLLEANRVVPVSRLVDALWNETPPATAKSQVHISVSALRRLLGRSGAQLIETRSPGYVLRTPDDAVDLKRFEDLAAKGAAAAAEQRLQEATRHYRAALALWRGPAMAGIESRVIRVYATRWDETRLTVLEDCLDLELQLGRHREIIGELSELVAEHPLRERLRAQMMLALYRSGRQADALDVFRAGREILQQELGLDPGKDLRRLESAILASDRSLDLPGGVVRGAAQEWLAATPAPHQLPAATADFTGRDQLIEQVLALLSPDGADDRARRVPVVVLTGKGGVGKTALALIAAHQLQDRYPDGQLFTQMRNGGEQPESSGWLLERFLRSFGIAPAALPAEVADQAALYRSWLAERRVLIVIDDASSVNQVIPLLPGSAQCAVIVTSRNRLAGLEGASQLEVGALDEPSGMALVARLIGRERADAEEDAVRALVELCDNLPLALRIAAAKLAARPHWRISRLVRRLEDERRRLDELDLDGISVRATISFSFESLAADARRLLMLLSLLGPVDFASWVGAPLLDCEVDVAEDTLETLVEAHLVEVRIEEDGPLRYQLHDLVRIYAVERLVDEEPTEARGAALRRLLGCWLFLTAEAHRREYGGDFSVLHGDAERWPLPEATTDDLLKDPLGWFRSEHNALVAAVLQAGQAGLDEVCWDLAMTSVTLFESGSYVDDWRQSHERALAVVRAAGNRRGEAAMLYSLGTVALTGRVHDAAREFGRALELFESLDDVHGRALAQGGLAVVDRLGGMYGPALTRYQTALADFQRVGDLIGEAHMLRDMAQIHIDWRHFDIAERFLGQAYEVCRKLGARRVTAQIEYELAELSLHRGHLDKAEETFGSVWEIAGQGGDIVGQAYALLGLGVVRSRQGLHGQAEADLEDAVNLADDTGDLLLRGRALLALAEIDFDRDKVDHAMRRLNEALGALSDLGSAAVWRARVLEMVGRLHEHEGRTDAAEQAWRAAASLAGDADPTLAGQLSTALSRVAGHVQD